MPICFIFKQYTIYPVYPVYSALRSQSLNLSIHPSINSTLISTYSHFMLSTRPTSDILATHVSRSCLPYCSNSSPPFSLSPFPPSPSPSVSGTYKRFVGNTM